MFSRYIKWTLFSSISGVLAGIASAVFLILLDITTRFRDGHSIIIWFLPIGGFAIGWLYHYYGKDIAGGNNLILDEIHDPKKTTPLRMAPFVLLGTIVTQLFGGSVGREGAAVQMGASLSDQLSKVFRISREERKVLLVCGAGAGFGAAMATPWAGIVFGMEVINVGKLRVFALFECFVASFVAYFTAISLRAPHSHYPLFNVPAFTWKTLFCVALAGIVFGLSARAFALLTHFVEQFNARWIQYPPFKPMIAGIVLVVLYYVEGTYQYVGLGIPQIQNAILHPVSFAAPLYKAFFTAITVGSGYKGGEFIPLVFIGTTLGSALSIILPVSLSLLAAVGFAAVFAGAANTPIACSIMAVELFGFRIVPYAIVACLMSYYFSGNHGIYRSQKVSVQKHQKLLAAFVWLGEIPRRFLSK